MRSILRRLILMGSAAGGVAPAGAMRWDDGSYVLWDDGSYVVWG
jgi:hypothetical protein